MALPHGAAGSGDCRQNMGRVAGLGSPAGGVNSVFT